MKMLAAWGDTPNGYGIVSRTLHWGMAVLFVWQFVTVVLRVAAYGTEPARFFWSTHYTVGVTLWVLVILRGIWGLANAANRPAREGPPLLARAAAAGHVALYALMVVVPLLAIARAAGSGRGFSVYGIQLVAPGGEPNPLLTGPGNLAHGLLGWVLFALIAGHVAMALFHAFVRRDATWDRMARGASGLRA